MKNTKTKQGFRNAFLFVISLAFLFSLVSALTYEGSTATTTQTISGSISSATLTTPNQTWFNFDRNQSYVNRTTLNNNPISKNLNHSGIIKFKVYDLDTALTRRTLFNSVKTSPSDVFGISITNKTLHNITIGVYNGSMYIANYSVFFNNTGWNTLVWSKNDSGLVVYLNGNKITTTGAVSVGTGLRTTVSIDADTQTNTWLNSSVDYVKAFDYSLSSTDILNFNNTGTLPIWKKLANITTVREQHGMEYCGNYVWISSGRGVNGHLNDLWAYDLNSKTWTQKASIPYTSQSGIFRCYANTDLIYAGGHDSENNTIFNFTYMYNIASNSWTQKSLMPYGVEDMGSALVGNQLFVLGGLQTLESVPNAPKNLTQIYNISQDVWYYGSQMPDKKWSGDFATSYGNYIYVISGTNNFSGYPNLTNNASVYVYNITNNSYFNVSNIPVPVSYKEAVTVGDSIYVLGGAVINQTNGINLIQVYNITTNTWNILEVKLPSYLGIKKYGALTTNGSSIFWSGGGDGSTKTDAFYEFYYGSPKSHIFEWEFNSNETNVYDNSRNGNNGSISSAGATWQTDGQNVTLRGNIDYTLVPGAISSTLTFLGDYVGSYDYFILTYTILSVEKAGVNNLCTNFTGGIGNFSSILPKVFLVLGALFVLGFIALLVYVVYQFKDGGEINMAMPDISPQMIAGIIVTIFVLIVIIFAVIFGLSSVCDIAF